MRPAHWQPPAESMVAAKIAIEGSDYFASDELSEILIGGPSHHLHARLRQQGTLLGLRPPWPPAPCVPVRPSSWTRRPPGYKNQSPPRLTNRSELGPTATSYPTGAALEQGRAPTSNPDDDSSKMPA